MAMDLRQGFCHFWRQSSPAPPPSVRTYTPASAVFPVQRCVTSRRRAAHKCLPASYAVAVDSTYQTSTVEGPALFEQNESQGFCSPDAACPAVLQTMLSKAHSSAASAALVVQDTPDEKLVATASLDKGMAIWRFYSSQGEAESMDESCDESIEVTRLKVPGAPVFSLAKIPEVLPDGTIVRKRPKPPGIYLGTSSKEVLTWMLGSKDVTDKVVLDGHTGWVRSLAVTGKWLFSCGCNYLRLWDTTFRTPKECDSVRLFTGDILAIAASDGRVFTAGADGSLRSWAITRAGDLEEGPSRDRAHDGRVSACAISGGRVFTVSYDGSVKAWDAGTLELIAEVRGAHGGDRIFCTAVGANGVLFTGGDDKLIRAWDQDLNPVGVPLEAHGASVRVLSAGRRAALVSGDADGDVCVWETYPLDLHSASKSTLLASVPPEPSVARDAAASSPSSLEGAAAALATGEHPVGPSAVQVTMAESAMQQLETMFAAASSEPQPGVQHQPEGAAAEFAPAEDLMGAAATAEWQGQQLPSAYAVEQAPVLVEQPEEDSDLSAHQEQAPAAAAEVYCPAAAPGQQAPSEGEEPPHEASHHQHHAPMDEALQQAVTGCSTSTAAERAALVDEPQQVEAEEEAAYHVPGHEQHKAVPAGVWQAYYPPAQLQVEAMATPVADSQEQVSQAHHDPDAATVAAWPAAGELHQEEVAHVYASGAAAAEQVASLPDIAAGQQREEVLPTPEQSFPVAAEVPQQVAAGGEGESVPAVQAYQHPAFAAGGVGESRDAGHVNGGHAPAAGHMNAATEPGSCVNGSGGYAALAAPVAEDMPEHAHAVTAVAPEEAEVGAEVSKPPLRRIEVESVASAVAAACLSKDLDGRHSVGVAAGGRSR